MFKTKQKTSGKMQTTQYQIQNYLLNNPSEFLFYFSYHLVRLYIMGWDSPSSHIASAHISCKQQIFS